MVDISGCRLLTGREHERASQGTGNVPYFDLNAKYMGIYICKNVQSCTSNICSLYGTYSISHKKKKRKNKSIFGCSCSINMANTSFIQRLLIKISKEGLCTVKTDVSKSTNFMHEKDLQAFSSLFLQPIPISLVNQFPDLLLIISNKLRRCRDGGDVC